MRGFEAWRGERGAATKMVAATSPVERDQAQAERDRLAKARTGAWEAMAGLIRDAEAGLSVAKR